LSITTNTISLNTVPVSNGGTGATTLTGILLGDGTNTITAITDGSADTFLKTDGSGGYSFSDVGGGDVLKTGTIAQNKIAIWNDNDSTLRSDATLTIDADHKITLYQPNSVLTDLSNYNIGGGNINTVTGTNNIGFGKNNLNSVTSGGNNVAIGFESLKANTTGNYNVVIGETLKLGNVSSSVAIGYWSQRDALTGGSNTSVGFSSLSNGTATTACVGIGSYAGNNLRGVRSTAIGTNALSQAEGSYNTALGAYSLEGAITASGNTGTYNTAIGYEAGMKITSGSYNVVIGGDRGTSIATLSNRIIISDGAGNIRQTFDASGDATFNGALSGTSATFSGLLEVTNSYVNFTRGGQLLQLNPNYGNANIYAQIDSALPLSLAVGGVDALTIASTGAATFNATDSTGNRTNPFNTLTITTDNPNLPYDKFGGSILFNNRSYTHGIVSSARIRSYIHDNGNSEGGGFIFETTPTVVGALTPTLTLSHTGAATFSSSVTAGGDVNIPNGNYYYAKRNTGSANINILGIANGTDTTTLKGGTSGATTSIIFADTGGDIARFFNGVLQANYGISFPNASVSGGTIAATPLNAYEEGTFTPTLTPETSGTITLTSGNNSYTRIGRLVIINGLVEVSSVSSPIGGDVNIGGFPFTSNSIGHQRTAGSARCFSLVSGASNITMVMVSSVTNGVFSGLDASLLQTGSQIYYQITYTV
jgi:hypothetical protein